MEFSDPIVSGIVLVRPAIRSPNYETSGGTQGWSINEDGSAVFNDITSRGDIQSADYVPNTSGYHLDYATGSAEFNELEARGDIVAGSFATGTTGKRVEVRDDGTFAEVLLYSGDPQETTPGALGSTPGNYGAVTQSFTTLYSNEDGAGYVNITLVPPFAGSPTPQGAIFVGGSEPDGVNLIMSPETKFYSQNLKDATAAEIDQPFQIGADSNRIVMDRNGISKFINTSDPGNLHLQRYQGDVILFNDAAALCQMFVSENGQLILQNTRDVNLTDYNSALLIGDTGGEHLAFDGNEIMARDSTSGLAAATLNFQNNGGLVNIGGGITAAAMRPDDDAAAANVVTTSTVDVTDNTNGPNFTFEYPPSGRVIVLFMADVVNSGAGFSTMKIRIRDNNSGGTIRFTSGSDETLRKEGTGRVTACCFARPTGLPTSGTGFIEGLYLATSGTATFRNARILVIPSV